MTKFNKDQFHFHGGYLTYWTNVDKNGLCDWKDRLFVARFKRGGMGSFKTFLIKNFTVEEYFSLRAGAETNPTKDNTPLGILESKGYIQPHVRKWMKEAGYTTINMETKKHWFENVYCKQFKTAA